jgi:histidinol-phosphate/aromatic aminotransferase/cobyric acid decarboxylase-like protein
MRRERCIVVRTWKGKTSYEGLLRITVPGEKSEFKKLANAIHTLARFKEAAE